MTQASTQELAATKAAAQGNRRAAIRYRCAPATVGKVYVKDQREFQYAWVLDLSLKGIGMQVPRKLEPGLAIAVVIKTHDGKRARELDARVVHCRALKQGEWYAGCELTIRLSDDELDELL